MAPESRGGTGFRQHIRRPGAGLAEGAGDRGLRTCHGYPKFPLNGYGNNWSERHAAYACGLGIFGLSKGIITEKGMAGRLSSIIMALEIEPDARPYTEIYEYCSICGKCVRRCGAGVISLEHEKKHPLCKEQLLRAKQQFAP